MAKTNNPLQFFNDAQDARVEKFQATAGVINNYSKKKSYGKAGGPSYYSENPAPSFKKGGSMKNKC